MNKILLGGGAALCLLGASPASQAGSLLLIDDFTYGFTHSSQGMDVDVNPDASLSYEVRAQINSAQNFDFSVGYVRNDGILGGEREIYVTVARDTLAGAGSAQASASSGIFSHNQTSGFFGSSTITWDGEDAAQGANEALWTGIGTGTGAAGVNTQGLSGAGTLGGLDLTLFTDFQLEVASADHPAAFELRLWDWSGNLASFGDSISPTATPIPFSISMANFDSIDLGNIGAIQLFLDGTQATSFDLSLGSLAAVPEPVSVGLFGLGLLGLAGARRRRAA